MCVFITITNYIIPLCMLGIIVMNEIEREDWAQGLLFFAIIVCVCSGVCFGLPPYPECSQ